MREHTGARAFVEATAPCPLAKRLAMCGYLEKAEIARRSAWWDVELAEHPYVPRQPVSTTRALMRIASSPLMWAEARSRALREETEEMFGSCVVREVVRRAR